MFRPIRTAISVVVLVGALWVAFAVKIGDKTFAEHVDTISETPEAKQLVDDTRATINPALSELRDRVLGEYVEAPTWIPDLDPATAPSQPLATSEEPSPARVAEPPLPGRKSSRPEGLEPPLPGRSR